MTFGSAGGKINLLCALAGGGTVACCCACGLLCCLWLGGGDGGSDGCDIVTNLVDELAVPLDSETDLARGNMRRDVLGEV